MFSARLHFLHNAEAHWSSKPNGKDKPLLSDCLCERV